jgi:hypothetical protein
LKQWYNWFFTEVSPPLLIYDDGSEVYLQNNEQNVQVSDTTGVQYSYKAGYQKQKPQTKTFPIFVIHQS